METIKSLIPYDLKLKIGESTSETLTESCASVLSFLNNLPQFHCVIRDLTDPELALCRKSKEKALELKQQGNACFCKGDYAKAISFYSQALRYAPMTDQDMDVSLIATIYVNRASSLHKMDLSEECIRDCSRAIILSPAYAKAWYRRGKANASLKNYAIAIHDLETSIVMEGSPPGKNKIKEELNLIMSHFSSEAGRGSCPNDKSTNISEIDELHDIKLESVITPLKGRGMVSPNDIPAASLLHKEEPLAAILVKSCRETHCHFCFNEVPADVLFCLSCTIPIYCSQDCQHRAGGKSFTEHVRNQNVLSLKELLAADVTKHVMDTVSSTNVNYKANYLIPEHRHECGGAHWSAVLPIDIVLAGRLLAKSKEKGKTVSGLSTPVKILDLAHNYNEIPPDSKLELHIYALVLSYCIQCSYGLDFPSIVSTASQLVLLISQIKINSMAVVRMKSLEGCEAFDNSSRLSGIAFTSSLQQVQVGQAIYSSGSLFNHSCQPNIHAYFLSRTLLLRSTEFVPAYYPLELSYGPQVGEQSLQERQALLKERYSFKCQCRGCSELILSDIVVNAFRCVQHNCIGAISEMVYHKKLSDDSVQVSGASLSCKLSLPVAPKMKDVSEVACMLLQESTSFLLERGHCLNCGSYRDLESLKSASEGAMVAIEKLKDPMLPTKSAHFLVSDGIKMLSHLRLLRHPYSKIVAQAEDTIAEAFIKTGEFEYALQHCNESIKILEKLYGASQIVIAHELMKLASIQLSLGDRKAAACNIERLGTILTLYYGPHATQIIPHLEALRREAESLAS